MRENRVTAIRLLFKHFDVYKLISVIIQKDGKLYEVKEILEPDKRDKKFEVWLEETETGQVAFFKADRIMILKFYNKFKQK